MSRIGIIGFGKIGQGIAAHILTHDIEIRAIDTNTGILSSFQEGSYRTNEPGVEPLLIGAYSAGRLLIGSDFSAIADCEAIIIAIPLLVDDRKKIRAEPFLDCLRNVATHCAQGAVVVIETSM